MSRFVALILLLAFPASAHAQVQMGASRQSPEILASGVGVVKLKPDQATITVAVVTRGPSAAEAGRLNVDRIVPLIAALKRQGLPDSAIVSTGYTVSVERDPYGRPTTQTDAPPIYVSRNAIRVSLRNLNELGAMVDTALASGASEVANITFSSTQVTAARQRAIAGAVQTARTDAVAAAEAAGGTLGDVIEVNLVPGYGYGGGGGFSGAGVGEYSLAAPAVVSTPLMPSDVTVSVQVQVRYAFVPRR